MILYGLVLSTWKEKSPIEELTPTDWLQGKLFLVTVFVTATENKPDSHQGKPNYGGPTLLWNCQHSGLPLGPLSGHFMKQDFPLVTISMSLKTRRHTNQFLFSIDGLSFWLRLDNSASVLAHHCWTAPRPSNLETQSPLISSSRRRPVTSSSHTAGGEVLTKTLSQGLSPLTMTTSTLHPDLSPSKFTDWFHKTLFKCAIL